MADAPGRSGRPGLMLCLFAGAVAAPLMAAGITLSWTHSVEKVLWEEDWRAVPGGVELVAARVRGSGAGMDPPPEARFLGGAWSWRPRVPVQERVVLRRSGATADWRICIEGACRPMAAFVPAEADPIELGRCE